MPLQAIIFDIGNVLLRFDFQLALDKLAHHCTPASETILHLIEPVKAAYEGGRMERADFQAQVREILRYTGSDADFISAWEDIFTENTPMVEAVRQLHGTLPLYLLSNTSDIHLEFVRRQYPFFSCFQDGVYSYLARASKPEPEIYEIARQQFGVEPSHTLFVDDLLPNIEAAAAVGFQTHHYHYDRHAAFLAQLEAAGHPLAAVPSAS